VELLDTTQETVNPINSETHQNILKISKFKKQTKSRYTQKNRYTTHKFNTHPIKYSASINLTEKKDDTFTFKDYDTETTTILTITKVNLSYNTAPSPTNFNGSVLSWIIDS